VFPEYSYEWLEAEFDTVATRAADPFYISEKTKAELRQAYPYWKGKTTSDLAKSNMSPKAYDAFVKHGVFTPGNYFYNGIGHVNVDYAKVLKIGYRGIIQEAKNALEKVEGVTAVTVSLEKKNAVVSGSADAEALKNAVIEEGYEVLSVE
jgi:formate C-acetyltransferase